VNVAMLFPDRVERLILGGHRFAAPPDPQAAETWRHRIEPLQQGDWQGFFKSSIEAYPDLGDPAIAAWLRGDNDPLAGAAVLSGQWLIGERVSIDLSRFRDRTLVYVGSEEYWLQPEGALEQLRNRCEDAGVLLEVIQGAGHLPSFIEAGQVIPVVRRYLEAAEGAAPLQ